MTAVVKMNRHDLVRAVELAGMILERVRIGIPLNDAIDEIKCGRNEPDAVWNLATRRAENAA